MTTMIGLPLVSILMFILAGVLIGHLFGTTIARSTCAYQ